MPTFATPNIQNDEGATPQLGGTDYQSRHSGEQIDDGVDKALAGGGGKKCVRKVVGTSTAGWTAADCDYLCDGVADHIEISAAIASLPDTGGEVVLLDGTYSISASIIVNRPNVTLSGNGHGTTLDKVQVSCATLALYNGGCTVRGLRFTGTEAHFTAISSFNGDGSAIFSNVVISNNVFECDGFSTAIFLENCRNCIIHGNTFSDGNYAAVFLYGGCRDVSIAGNLFTQYSGIYLFSSYQVSVSGNVFTNSQLYVDQYSDTITISGNSFDNWEDEEYCISFAGKDSTIVGNTLCHILDEGDIGLALKLSGRDNLVACNNLCDGPLENTGINNTIISSSPSSDGLSGGGNVTGTLRIRDLLVGGFTDGEPDAGEDAKSSVRVNGMIEGHGQLEIHGTAQFDNDATVNGSMTVKGTLRAENDTITHTVKPNATNTYNLGLAEKRYKSGHFKTIYADDLYFVFGTGVTGVPQTSLAERMVSFYSQLAEQNDDLDTLAGRLVALTAEVDAVKQSLQTQTAQIAALNDQLAALTDRVAALEGGSGSEENPEVPEIPPGDDDPPATLF